MDPRRRRELRRRLGLAALAAGLILGVVLGLVWLQRAMIFPREYPRQVPAALSTPGLERLWLETPEGRIEAWVLPGDGVDAEHSGPAVVFGHGNAELIDHWPDALAPYRRLGVSVVLPEYRGYGRSAGRPSESAISDDLALLQTRLRAHPLIDSTRIVFHGRSLGGGAVCTMLDRFPPRALVLESTFTSIPDLAAAMYVPPFLIVDRFDSAAAIERYDGPLLVFHGTRDTIVPADHGRRLAELRPAASELVLYDVGHNDLPPRDADYWARIERFLRRAGVLTSS